MCVYKATAASKEFRLQARQAILQTCLKSLSICYISSVHACMHVDILPISLMHVYNFLYTRKQNFEIYQ